MEPIKNIKIKTTEEKLNKSKLAEEKLNKIYGW